MRPEELIELLKENQLAPVYFLFGEERFYQLEIISKLTRLIVTPENKEFNVETFEAKFSNVEEWIGAANTISFFGGCKLITVRNLHEKSLDISIAQPLLKYLEHPAPRACLVLTADKIDRKRKLDKVLASLDTAVECSPPPERTMPLWLQKRAKTRDFQMTANASRLMVERIGPNPGLLASELEKIMTYAGKLKKIDTDLIEALVGIFKLENIFDLTNALKSKDTERALHLLGNQLEHGEEPLKILGAIIWQFRLIWEVRHYLQQRIPIAQIARTIGLRPFIVEKTIPFAKTYNQQDLRKGFEILFQADREMKTTGNDTREILIGLILRLGSTN